MRLLKLDPRPPAFDSVAEAAIDEESSPLLDASVEHAEWSAIAPPRPGSPPKLAFVDGVQQIEARVSAEGEGWPSRGIVASYAAGAICPGADPPVRHCVIGRRVILARGRRASPVRLEAQSGCFVYESTSSASEDPNALDATLAELRAQLETQVVRALLDDGAELVVVDGRLPPVVSDRAVGLIKTPHRVPITAAEHVEVLLGMRTGERSPIFTRQRSSRTFYSWFVCLATPGAHDLSPSGLALFEMDDAAALSDATRIADLTASVLPAYASTPKRDLRAPQNLLPVSQLEKHLRHRLGDAELRLRLLRRAFARKAVAWEP
jgi:hypothetical protein